MFEISTSRSLLLLNVSISQFYKTSIVTHLFQKFYVKVQVFNVGIIIRCHSVAHRMPTDVTGGPGLAVVAGDILALRGTGLAAAETWALLCQAAQALQDLFLSSKLKQITILYIIRPNIVYNKIFLHNLDSKFLEKRKK